MHLAYANSAPQTTVLGPGTAFRISDSSVVVHLDPDTLCQYSSYSCLH